MITIAAFLPAVGTGGDRVIGYECAAVRRLALLLLILALGSPGYASAHRAPISDWEPTGIDRAVVKLSAPGNGAVFAQMAEGAQYASPDGGSTLLRSDDEGATWVTVPLPPPRTVGTGELAHELPRGDSVLDPTDPAIIYAPGSEGLYKSEDGAANWRLILPTDLSVKTVAVSPADPRLLYVALLGPAATTGPGLRFLRSQDGGVTWDQLQDEPSHPFQCGWDVPLLEPHPTDTDRVFRTVGCYSGRPNRHSLQMSADRGVTWSDIWQARVNIASPSGDGLGQPERIVGGQGQAPHRFYLGTSGANNPQSARGIYVRGLYRTDDDGATWLELPPSMPSLWWTASLPNASRSVVVDPTYPDRVYAGLTGNGVKVSSDAGMTWADLGRQNLPPIHDMTLSADRLHLYVATDGGVFRMQLREQADASPAPYGGA